MTVVAVAVAAAVGAVSRHLVDQAVRARAPGFPWATLVVNTTGSFALAVIVGVGLPSTLRTVAGTGFVGAFTTFSTFGLDLVRTAEGGGARPAGAYVVAGVVGGLVAGTAGLAVTGAL